MMVNFHAQLGFLSASTRLESYKSVGYRAKFQWIEGTASSPNPESNPGKGGPPSAWQILALREVAL
jgi:hypothetical protein